MGVNAQLYQMYYQQPVLGSNALLFGVTSPVTRYYLPEVTLQVTSYFLQ